MKWIETEIHFGWIVPTLSTAYSQPTTKWIIGLNLSPAKLLLANVCVCVCTRYNCTIYCFVKTLKVVIHVINPFNSCIQFFALPRFICLRVPLLCCIAFKCCFDIFFTSYPGLLESCQNVFRYFFFLSWFWGVCQRREWQFNEINAWFSFFGNWIFDMAGRSVHEVNPPHRNSKKKKKINKLRTPFIMLILRHSVFVQSQNSNEWWL